MTTSITPTITTTTATKVSFVCPYICSENAEAYASYIFLPQLDCVSFSLTAGASALDFEMKILFCYLLTCSGIKARNVSNHVRIHA
jgi:hypothetical protein